MPDISMCSSEVCIVRKMCYRHSESGTRPSTYQSWADFKPRLSAGCDFYIPVHKEWEYAPNKEY